MNLVNDQPIICHYQPWINESIMNQQLLVLHFEYSIHAGLRNGTWNIHGKSMGRYFGFCIQGSKGTISTKLASDDVAFFWRALCIKIPMTHPAYECLLISMLYSFGMSVAHRIWQPFITNNTMEYQWINLNQFRNSSMKLGLWSYVDGQVNIKKMRIHSMHSDQLEEFTDNK